MYRCLSSLISFNSYRELLCTLHVVISFNFVRSARKINTFHVISDIIDKLSTSVIVFLFSFISLR